jgi:hypothetical protein
MNTNPDHSADHAEFELHCDGEWVAGASGPRARTWREIQHYAVQYAQDGLIEIFEVTRRAVEAGSEQAGSDVHESVSAELRAAIRREAVQACIAVCEADAFVEEWRGLATAVKRMRELLEPEQPGHSATAVQSAAPTAREGGNG